MVNPSIVCCRQIELRYFSQLSSRIVRRTERDLTAAGISGAAWPGLGTAYLEVIRKHAAATDANRQIPLALTRVRNDNFMVGWEEGVVSCSN